MLCWHSESNTAGNSLHKWVCVAETQEGCRAIGSVTGVVSIAGLVQSRIALRWEGVVSRVSREILFLSFDTTQTFEIVFNGLTWSIKYQASLPVTLEINRTGAQRCSDIPRSDSRNETGRSLVLDR